MYRSGFSVHLSKNIFLERRNSIMKKLIALLLAVMMLASVLVACGEKKEEEKKGSDSNDAAAFKIEDYDNKKTVSDIEGNIESGAALKVWCADKAVDLTKELCEEFKTKYADKNITIDVQVQGEDAAATQALNDIDAAADVFSFASDQLDRLMKADALAPVFANSDILARNSTSSLAACAKDQDLYAFPETGDNGYYLVYDKSVVTDEDAKTLEGVLAACRKAGRKFVFDAGNSFFSCAMPFTGGLTIEGVKDDVQQFNDYNEDEVVDTLAAFSELFHKYSDIFMSSEATRISAGMGENPRTVGAGIDGSWNSNAVLKALGDDFGAAKLPTINVNGTDKQIISMHGYKFIGVNSHSKAPNAAQALADFLTSEESQLKRAETLGWGPSNTKAAQSSVVSDSPVLSAIIDQANYSVPQMGIATTFWTPMGNLGNFLWKESSDKAAIKAEFEKAIENIKDE